MAKVDLHISSDQHFIQVDEAKVRQTVEHVLQHIGEGPASVSLALVDDLTMKNLKGKYCNRQEATDVLSFDLRDEGRNAEKICDPDAEIIVNAQCALRVASERGGDPVAEMHLYLVHGLLHQFGFDDDDPEKAQRMHAKEDQLLEELGFGKIYSGRD